MRMLLPMAIRSMLTISPMTSNCIRNHYTCATALCKTEPPAGALHAFDSINHFFLIGQMIIPGSSYWNIEVVPLVVGIRPAVG